MNHYCSLSNTPPTTLPPPTLQTPTEKLVDTTETHAKGGRPIGLTNEKKRTIDLAVIAAKNEVATRAHKVMRTLGKGKRMAKGALASIVHNVLETRNLPPDFKIPLATIHPRIRRNNLFAFHRGHTSHLLNMEPIFVSTIKQMYQIRQCLTPP